MAREEGHAARRKARQASVVGVLSEQRLQWSRDVTAAVWADPLSRSCALVGAVSLWLTVALTEPAFLAPLLGAATGVWFLRGHRALSREVVDDDDWF